MPGRKFTDGNGYRYGFNGKENDNEVKGEGNQQDYGMRIYDSRLGRFLSVDPLTKQYPMLTPYQFASNRPIDGVDLDGKEWAGSTTDIKVGETAINRVTNLYVRVKVINKSTMVTDSRDIKKYADAYKAGVESKFSNSSTYTEGGMTINHVIKTEVILDYTAEPAPEKVKTTINGEEKEVVQGIKYARLIFEDRVSKPDPNDPTIKVTTPGDTRNPFINGFTTTMAVTMDGARIPIADFKGTAIHEAGHSAGLNHPWELSNTEKGVFPALDQLNAATLNKKIILKNFMNSFENPNTKYRSVTGSDVLPKQLSFMIEEIKRLARYTSDQLRSDDPEKQFQEDFKAQQEKNN